MRRGSLADAERIATLVRARTSQNVVAWLAATAVASAFYLTGVGAAGRNLALRSPCSPACSARRS